MALKNMAENNLIRFINITKKKDSMYAKFKAQGLRGGTSFKMDIAVDLAAAEVDPSDPLEKIIEKCSTMAVREVKKTEFQFEGLIAN